MRIIIGHFTSLIILLGFGVLDFVYTLYISFNAMNQPMKFTTSMNGTTEIVTINYPDMPWLETGLLLSVMIIITLVFVCVYVNKEKFPIIIGKKLGD